MRQVELLSPAGDMECLRNALAFGADAVYLGAKSFGMRSSSANFSAREMQEAVSLAHAAGKRVYLTLNTMPVNAEIEAMAQTMLDAKHAGIDAFIIADLGVLSLARQYAPGMEIHFSTQAGITNYAAACEAHRMGAKRVVLARELSLEDIAFVRKNTPPELELEVFVHGAMCMSVSGRCLLSNYLTGRDANRGRCTQSCRWKYSLLEESRPGQQFEIAEDEAGSYILNADDLCAAPFLDKVVAAGADSLKIEGRAKSFYYVASVTAAYRAAVDAVLLDAGKGNYSYPLFSQQELMRTSHRPYSSGFFLGREGATQSPNESGYVREWQLIGVVEQSQQDGWLRCIQRGKFVLGEELEALLPEGEAVSFTPAIIKNEDGAPIEATPHTKMVFYLPAPEGKPLPPMSILRKRTPIK